MFKWLESRMLWGALLIIGGVLFLLQNIFEFQFGSLFWVVLLGLGGLFFLTIFFSDRTNWWGLIPGITLLSIALLVLINILAPSVGDALGGSIVLGGIATSFLIIYLINRDSWWAIIPSGVLYSLAIAIALQEVIGESAFISIFFIGMGITFAIIAILPTKEGKMVWAWIPAGVLVLMGLLFSAFTEGLIAYIWPAALILAGIFLIYRTFSAR